MAEHAMLVPFAPQCSERSALSEPIAERSEKRGLGNINDASGRDPGATHSAG